MEELLYMVDDGSAAQRKQLLGQLAAMYRKDQQLTGSFLVCSKLKTLLKDPDLKVVSKALKFFALIFADLVLETDLVHDTFPLVIPLCCNPVKRISLNATEILKCYQSATKNTEFLIKSLVSIGLRSEDAQLKTQTLLLIPQFLTADPSLSLTELRKLLENVIFLLNDRDQAMKKLALDCLDQVQGLLSNFNCALDRVSPVYYEQLQCERRSVQVFGFIPAVLYSSLVSANWRERLGGLHTLQSLFSVFEDSATLCAHKAQFFELLNSLLGDPNSRISSLALDLVSSVLLRTELLDPVLLGTLLPNCMAKLGDTKISTRQTVFALFKAFYCVLPPMPIYCKLLELLSSEKWLVRLEALHILILGALLLPRDCDYAPLVPDVAPLLDDSSPKIRFIAVDFLSLISSYNAPGVVLQKLAPIVDSDALKSLERRFADPAIPSIKGRALEFPKLQQGPSHNVSPSNTERELPDSHTLYQPRKTAFSVFPKDSHLHSDRNHHTTKSINSLIRHHTRKSIHTSVTSLKAPIKALERPAEAIYMKHEELSPLKDTSATITFLIDQPQCGWKEAFERINAIRSLSKHHTAELASAPALKGAVSFSMLHADNLRSTLSKNALLLIGELGRSFGRSLDNHTRELIKILMKRSTDSNSFISTEAKRSLGDLAGSLSESKVLHCVLKHFTQSNNSTVRANSCFCFEKVMEKAGNSLFRTKSAAQMVRALGKFLTDASVDVRNAAKLAFCALQRCSPGDFAAVLSQLPESQSAKAFAVINASNEQGKAVLRRSTLPLLNFKPRAQESRRASAAEL